jgi:glycosyltransferase involved in cell wall biosynthesis
MDKIKSLHIDIEGGWGGSSRSLYEYISRLDLKKFSPIVIHRKLGPITDKYKALNIPCDHHENLYTFVPRKAHSLKIFLSSIPSLLKGIINLKGLISSIKRHNPDIIHLNYEGLFFTGLCIKFFIKKPVICHIRTVLPQNLFSTIITNILAKYCNHIIFISENEQEAFQRLCFVKPPKFNVLYNMSTTAQNYQIDEVNRHHIIYLGNIGHEKGVDRLLEVASQLKKIGSQKIIHIYGSERSSSGYLQNFIENIGILQLTNIEYKGHTSMPEKVLSSAWLLIRPSRGNDPWGRDVIEALSFGVPVIATGSYDKFVINNFNGHLIESFDPESIANIIFKLENDPNEWKKLSIHAKTHAQNLFAGKHQMEVFANLLTKLHTECK